MAFSDFVTAVEQGDVREVTIQGQGISGQFRDGRQFQTYAPDDPNLVNTLRKQGVRIRALPSDEDSPTLFSIRPKQIKYRLLRLFVEKQHKILNFGVK